ncbi:unnamed protein product, partial [Scytosiphon promiscuus]
MPMGLASSPGWSQSIVLRVCEGLDRIRLFIDDIVCFSKTGREHVEDLPKVVNCLGHRVTAEELAPDPGKVEALLKMPMPMNISQLRSLLRAVSYYRDLFLPKLAAESKSLSALLKKGVRLEFTAEHTQIVQTLLEKL